MVKLLLYFFSFIIFFLNVLFFFKKYSNDIALDLLDSKKEDGTLIITDCQKNGRGRLGAKWISPRGNIYCSFALKTTTTLNNQYIYNKLTSLSIKDSLEYIGMQDVKFKWPNDIFFEKKKISGIIIENICNLIF